MLLGKPRDQNHKFKQNLFCFVCSLVCFVCWRWVSHVGTRAGVSICPCIRKPEEDVSVGGPDLLSSIILSLSNWVSHWTWIWAGGQWVPVILLYLPPTAFQVHVLLPGSLDECWDPDSCLHDVPQEFLPTESSPHSLVFTLITVFEPNLLLSSKHQFIPFNECVHKCTHLEGKGQPWMPFLKHCWLQFLRQCFGTYWTS